MYIWDEEIIEKLCDMHLKGLWDSLWYTRKLINKDRYTPNKNAQEFMEAPLHLAHRMNMVYSQILKRGLRVRRKPFDPFMVSDTPFTQLLKEVKSYVPRTTPKAQIDYLKKFDCDCKNNL